MLPSKGYFSAIPCVFYLAGNCERPHCHYRHCARDKTNNSSDGLGSPSEAIEERSWLGSNLSDSIVTKMVEKAVDKVFVEDPKRAETLDRDHIIKTALDKLKEETLIKKANANQKVQSSGVGFPSYKPTPIAELNKRHIPVVYAPERPLSAVRKEKGPDDKTQIGTSTLSSSSFSDSVQGLKIKSMFTTSMQGSVIDENSLDTKDDSLDLFSGLLDSQVEGNYSSIDGKNNDIKVYNMSSAISFPSSQTVTNTVDALCDDIFTEFSMNGLMAEQNSFNKEKLLEFDNGLLDKEVFLEKTVESTDEIAAPNANTLQEFIKMEVETEEKNDKNGGNESHKLIDTEKKSSHKDGSKSHHAKKSDKSVLCGDDKHKTQKSHDSTSKHKHERRLGSSSKDKHRSRGREKSDEQNHKLKCKGNGTDKEKKPSLPSDPSKKSVDPSKKDSSRAKKVDKMIDKNDKKYSKSSEKYDKKEKDKHHEKQKNEKRNQGSKSNCDENAKKSSSSKTSKHSSDHHKDKSIIKSASHSKAVPTSTSHRNDDVSKSKKRKLEEDLLQPDKRIKMSSQSIPEGDSIHFSGNNFSANIDIFRGFKKESDRSVESPPHDDDSLHAIDPNNDRGDEMDVGVDSITYSPEHGLDAISISSGDSSLAADNEDGWRVVTARRPKVKPSNEPTTSTKSDTMSSVSDTRWTKAKEIIQRNHNAKIRISHVPNVSNILSAKTRLLSKAPQTPPSYTTSATTDAEDGPTPKVVKRVAHGAQGSENRYPTLIHSQEIKMNASIRQYYCNIFHDEFVKFLNPEDARNKAAAEEFEVAKKSNLSKIYRNNCSLLLLKIRKSKGKLQKDETAAEKLDSSSAPDYTYGWNLYKCFSKYLMTDEEFIQHGYPMPLPGQSSFAYTEKSARRYSVQQPDKPFTRKCVNCLKLYDIDEDGMPTTSNDCFYHWGRLRKIPGRGQVSEKFTCCDGADDATPCQSSAYHVWSGRNEDCMPGFVKTREFPSSRDESAAGIYALDCEMCYTTRGLELARLTVVDLNEEVVFDEVVSLECPVLDYCTRFSGIDKSKMSLATYSFDDVQQWVLDNVYDKTILVGHSLENDLKVLKIFHKRVVDTSITFPHKFGFPQKCSLKYLASSILSMAIQESEHGHDSKEDAVACLKLMMTKIKDDSKVRKPRVIIGFSGKKR